MNENEVNNCEFNFDFILVFRIFRIFSPSVKKTGSQSVKLFRNYKVYSSNYKV